jgi:photosystem II stability/assembly factor-like uncharacterized protein
VPVSASLTKVAFVDNQRGWAVGHYGVVLHSADAGETWQVQLDGRRVAALVSDALRRKALRSAGADAERHLRESQRWLSDGPDKPFLDLHFADERNGFVVGAYNLALRTRDGGRTWEDWSLGIDNPEGLHLYAVAGSGNVVYLAGERGLFLRSEDGGETFARMSTPHKASYFALAVMPGAIVLAGLRGHAIRSTDSGASWTALDVHERASITAAAAKDGKLVLGNQAGQVFASNDGGRTMRTLAAPPVRGLTGLAIAGKNALLASGVDGITRIAVPDKDTAKP